MQLPVQCELWKQKETWDGTYNMEDLMEILPAVRVKLANQVRMF